MLKFAWAFLLVGCVMPPSSPPAGQAGAAPAAAPAAEAQLGCQQLFECFQACPDGACVEACMGRGDPASQAAATAVIQCGNNCKDRGDNCIQAECTDEFQTCQATGAVAQAGAAPAPAPAAGQPQPQPQPQPAAPAASAATSIHAAALVSEFEKNEVRAQQWIGQRVRVNGTVNSVEIAKDGRISLTFKSSVSTYGNARCYFSQSDGARTANMQTGVETTVDGTVRGWEDGYGGAKTIVYLDGCTVP